MYKGSRVLNNEDLSRKTLRDLKHYHVIFTVNLENTMPNTTPSTLLN